MHIKETRDREQVWAQVPRQSHSRWQIASGRNKFRERCGLKLALQQIKCYAQPSRNK